MREVDRILTERVWPRAEACGFRRRGRLCFKENVNGDIVMLFFRPADRWPDRTELRASIRLDQGISRRLRYGMQRDPLPIEFVDSGDWYWEPPVPFGFQSEHHPHVFDDITSWGAAATLDSVVTTVWLPIMDQVVVPGAMTADLRRVRSAFPGHMSRSRLRLALSEFNDGCSERSPDEIADIVSHTRPLAAQRLREGFRTP